MWFKSATSSEKSQASRWRNAVSVLNGGLKVEGDIISDGEIQVVGSLSGNLTAYKLTLSEGGSINGNVRAESAVIHGQLAGRLAAAKVVIGRTAQVTADIIYVSMQIEPGAALEGYSRRVDQIETAAAAMMSLPAPRPLADEPARPAVVIKGD
ncbi:MAG TPA: polymer-forming cytoskeletal protein [Stellaceae bacterium]|nr:polymer-forming cytoskeletal protein [Stellaceae bacterium]